MATCALDGRTVIIASASQTVFTIVWDATLVADTDVLLWLEDVSAGTPGAEVTQGAGAGKFVVDRTAGTCTLGTAAEVGDIITIERHQSSPTRLTTFTNPGDLIPQSLNDEFDHFLQLLEDLGRDRCRSVRMDRGVSLTGLDLELPAPVSGSAIGWTDATTLGNIGIVITGGGTLNTIPLWTPDGFTLGDSVMSQSGTVITVAGGITASGIVTAGSGPTVLTTAAGLLRHQAIDPSIAGTGLSVSSGVLSADSGNLSGSGTNGTIPLWTPDGDTLGDSALTQSGGNVTVAGSFSVFGLVTGNSVLTVQQNRDTTNFALLNVSHTSSSVAGDAIINITTGGPSGGDPYIQWAVTTGQSYAMGIDNSDSDKLVGTVGSILGTSPSWLEVTIAGAVLLPGVLSAGSSPTVLTTAAGLLRHQAIDPDIAGSGITYTLGVLSATAGDLSGSGTDGTIPLWGAGGVVLGDSIISQSSTVITVAGTFIVAGSTMDVNDSVVGSRVLLHVQNTDSTNTGSHSIVQITSTLSTGGNPYLLWQISSTQSYTQGIDNSDSDKFVGSVGTTPGTANWLEVTTARGIMLDAASGQTVALAVNATEELQVSGTAVTIPTNNLIITAGRLGIGKVPLADLHVDMQAAATLTTLDGSLFLEAFANGGTGNFGAGIILGQPNGGTVANRGASIVAVEGSTGNSVELSFNVHGSGAGDPRFESLRLDSLGNVGIGVTPTLPLDVNAKAGVTSIGGYAIKLTNKTGSNTVKGQLVIASTSGPNAFETAGASDDRVIGIVLESGVADSSEAWMVVAGFAQVLMDAGGAGFGNRIISSTTAGSGLVDNGPATPQHFQEIGHSMGTTAGGGLVKCSIHLN